MKLFRHYFKHVCDFMSSNKKIITNNAGIDGMFLETNDCKGLKIK